MLKVARACLNKDTFLKIKRIEDEKELREALNYCLVSYLEKEMHLIDKKIKELEKNSFDIFFIKNNALLLPSRLKHFQVEFDEKEFHKMSSLINKIKEEIKVV